MNFLRVIQWTILFCLFAPAAHAYLDPGTGSLILQLIIGAVAAASLIFKTFWLRVKSLFGSIGGSTSTNSELPQKSAPLHASSEVASKDQKSPSGDSRSF